MRLALFGLILALLIGFVARGRPRLQIVRVLGALVLAAVSMLIGIVLLIVGASQDDDTGFYVLGTAGVIVAIGLWVFRPKLRAVPVRAPAVARPSPPPPKRDALGRVRKRDLERDREAMAAASESRHWFRVPTPEERAARRLACAWEVLAHHAGRDRVATAREHCTQFLKLYGVGIPAIEQAALTSEIQRDVARWVEAWLDIAIVSPKPARIATLTQVMAKIDGLAARAQAFLEAEVARRRQAFDAAMDTSHRAPPEAEQDPFATR